MKQSAFFFFFNDTATTEIYTLSLHDALPISVGLEDVPSAMRLARCQRKEAGGDERMHRARQHALLLAVALRRFLDRAQVALHVKRVDAVLPLLARRLFVRVRQHRLRERGRDL